MASWKRAANQAELNKWNEFKFYFEKATFEIQIRDLLRANYATAVEFGKTQKIALGAHSSDKEPGLSKSASVDAALFRVSAWIKWVEDGTLGIQANGADLDITAPADTNSDLLAKYKNPNFAGWPFVVFGVVVVASIIAYIALIRSELARQSEEYNALLDVAESKYCVVPGSDLCKAWLSRKQASGFNEKKTLIDDLKAQAAALVQTIGKAATSALPIVGAALALYLLFTFSRERARR